MIPLRRLCAHPIHHVIVYKGHEKHPLFGPYPANIEKRIAMFTELNRYREAPHRPPWKVTAIAGENLIAALRRNPRETLLVVPVGQSSRLDRVFADAETAFLQEEFFARGGRGYFNCGSAYWVSKKRIYRDLCEEQPERREPIIKTTQLPLFQGTAEGPLCPFPGIKYKVGFFSDAVRVTDGQSDCTIYLSGGGCFRSDAGREQKVRVLVRYVPSELLRLGKKESQKWQTAALLASVKEGAILLSMFHPYYGPHDIDVEAYLKAFPDCGTDWRRVKERLSSLDVRMRFVYQSMLCKLEEMDF